MSIFRTLVEETLESIKARKERVNLLFDRIKNTFLNNSEKALSIYNKNKSVVLNLRDEDYTIEVVLDYNPDMVHKYNVFMAFSYDLDLEKKLCAINIFVDRLPLNSKMLSAYFNSVMFDTRLKHELLHYLDERQSNFRIQIPDYDSMDNDKMNKVYFNRPEEIHAILYSTIDRLKGKDVNLQDKADIIRVVKETDKEMGEMLEDFFTEADPKNIHKFMKNLYNGLQ